MVEAAIVAVLLALLLTGILGGALYMRTYAATSNAANDAARAGSIGGTDPAADWDALQAAGRDLSALGKQNLQRIVIYKASGPSTQPPAICATAAPGSASLYGICNVYVPSDLALTESQFTAPGNSHDNSWAASTRRDSRAGASDWIGVQVIADCGCFLQSFGYDAKVTKWSTVKLESNQS